MYIVRYSIQRSPYVKNHRSLQVYPCHNMSHSENKVLPEPGRSPNFCPKRISEAVVSGAITEHYAIHALASSRRQNVRSDPLWLWTSCDRTCREKITPPSPTIPPVEASFTSKPSLQRPPSYRMDLEDTLSWEFSS